MKGLKNAAPQSSIGLGCKMLYGLSLNDPLTLLAASACIAGVTFAAAILPARRAASIEPIRALRTD